MDNWLAPGAMCLVCGTTEFPLGDTPNTRAPFYIHRGDVGRIGPLCSTGCSITFQGWDQERQLTTVFGDVPRGNYLIGLLCRVRSDPSNQQGGDVPDIRSTWGSDNVPLEGPLFEWAGWRRPKA